MTKIYGKENGLKSKYLTGFGKKYIIYSNGKIYNTLTHKYVIQPTTRILKLYRILLIS